MALRQFSKAFTLVAGPGDDVKTQSSAALVRSILADNRRRVQNLQGPVFEWPSARCSSRKRSTIQTSEGYFYGANNRDKKPQRVRNRRNHLRRESGPHPSPVNGERYSLSATMASLWIAAGVEIKKRQDLLGQRNTYDVGLGWRSV